jgi:pilus assembly protein CpaE
MRQCVLVHGAFAQPDSLAAALVRAGFAPPLKVDSVQSALATLEDHVCELLILPVGGVSAAQKGPLEALLRGSSSLVAIGTASEASAELVLSAMRAGIAEFLLSTASPDELAAAIGRLEHRWANAPVRGAVTAVFSPKGGQGATTIAVNLAHALARRSSRVVILDMVLAMGDVALQLDLRPDYDMGELAQKVDRLDRELLQSVAASGPDGLSVLAATERLDLAPILTGDVVAALLAQCRQTYEHTVVDCEHAFESRTVATLDAADRILLVAQLQVSSLVVAKRTLSVFKELGYDDDKIQVVVNREGSTNLVTPAEAQRVLGHSIDARIPNDFANASEAQAQGVPFLKHAANSPLAKAYEALAARIGGPSTLAWEYPNGSGSASAAKKGRLFGLLRR